MCIRDSFDNDKWAKFVEYPVAYSRMSYEFTVLHEENSEGGLVPVSYTHLDVYKRQVLRMEIDDRHLLGIISEVSGDDEMIILDDENYVVSSTDKALMGLSLIHI